VPHAPEADLLALPGRAPIDVFSAFWLPFARRAGPALHLAAWMAAGAIALLASRWWRPRAQPVNASWVDENLCTGCTTCSQDCPYEAIAMVERSDFSRQSSALMARVDPSLCVGCGICAGSCAPMGVGPGAHRPGSARGHRGPPRGAARPAGRDRGLRSRGCRRDRSPRRRRRERGRASVACAGSLPTAVIETPAPRRRRRPGASARRETAAIARGRSGSPSASTPAARPSCTSGRPARVAYGALSTAETPAALALLAELQGRVRALGAVVDTGELEAICDPPLVEEEIRA
jgi:ferredoxin